LLTDPFFDELSQPGVGALSEEVGVSPKISWVVDALAEILVERKIGGAARVASKKAFAKMAGLAYDDAADLATKGSKTILGRLGDDEIKALDEARRLRRVGVLGTRPPQGEIDDAVTRAMDYIASSSDAKMTKEMSIHLKRKAGAARIYQAMGEGYGPGYYKRLRGAGAISETEASFVPFIEVSKDAATDLAILQQAVDNFEFAGKSYTMTNVHEALWKLYESGQLLRDGEVELIRDVFGSGFADSISKFQYVPKTAAGKVAHAAGMAFDEMSSTAAAVMTTGEVSHLMRQLNHRLWTRPRAWARSAFITFRSLMSEDYALKASQIINHQGQDAVKAGLRLNQFGDVSSGLRMEHFRSSFLHKVPIVRNYMDMFERAYVNGINVARLDYFDEGAEIIKRSGKWSDDLGKYVYDEKVMKQWADTVNNVTGWADIEKLAGTKHMRTVVSAMNKTMLAPRFTVARWAKHYNYAKTVFGENTPNALRSIMVRDTVKKWLAYNKVAQYAVDAGYEVETDPKSSDYLKLKKGNTRIGVLGGDTQIPVLLMRLATGETKDTSTGEIKEAITNRVAQQYLSGKLSPMVSVAYDYFIAQETFEGEDIKDPQVMAETFASKFVQLYIRDLHDAVKDQMQNEGKSVFDSLTSVNDVAAMGFLGADIQTYSPSARKQIEDIYNLVAYREFATPYHKLTVGQKDQVVFLAGVDYEEQMVALEAEAGFGTPSPGGAAKMQERNNRSMRKIRGMLGDDYALFKGADVDPGFLPRDLNNVRLNDTQHNKYHELYVKYIQQQLADFPQIMMLPRDEQQSELQYMLEVAREDAKYDMLYEE
jgi:hypothetical protein